MGATSNEESATHAGNNATAMGASRSMQGTQYDEVTERSSSCRVQGAATGDVAITTTEATCNERCAVCSRLPRWASKAEVLDTNATNGDPHRHDGCPGERCRPKQWTSIQRRATGYRKGAPFPST